VIRHCLVIISLLLSVVLAASARGFVIETIELDTPDGLARGKLAVIDLSDPAVGIRAIVPLREDGELAPCTTESLVREGQADLAVNANFFGGNGIIGLAVVDGTTISGPRGNDPVLLIHHNGRATITAGVDDLDEVAQGVAGVGPSSTAAVGTLLVKDGANVGATARVEAAARHPRTAAGVDAEGQTLFLLVIDGRQPGHSVGVTLPELADVLIRHGAHDALNLDGGGSSGMFWRDGDMVRGTRQSGEVRRVVPVHLGVSITPPIPTTQEASP
jgi:exopolysaccharide biosynthesis protein